MIKKHGNFFKKWLCPDYSRCQIILSYPKFQGGCSSPPQPPPPPPPARTPMLYL